MNSDPSPFRPAANDRTSRAPEWVLLEWEYAQNQQSPRWHLRYSEFCHSLVDWTDVDRTHFWNDVASLVNKDPRFAPTPGLVLTPEAFAREVRRLQKLIGAVTRELRDAGIDPHDEECGRPDWCSDPDCEPQGWLRFINPIVWSFNETDLSRYLSGLTEHLR